MAIDDQIIDENLKFQPYYQVKLINMNTMQVKKCYPLMKNK